MGNDLIVVANGASIGAATPIQMGGGGEAQPVGEKIVSALRGEFRSAAEATSRSPEVAESMVDAELEVGGVIAAGRLLTLTAEEAIDAGLAEARASDLDALLALVGLEDEEVIEVDESWAETLVRVLTSPMLSGLLMSLGMLGIFFELMSPGFGWAGILGISCLVVFFTGHFLVHLAGLEEVALFVGGVVLLGLEVFVIPGFGIAGVAGILAVGASLVMALINLDVDITLSPFGIEGALMRVIASMIGTIIAAVLLFKYVPNTAVGRRLVLKTALAEGSSLVEPAAEELSVGMTGTATTGLRPFGKARFGNQRAEVVSTGAFIDEGEAIRISRIAGGRIEVRPAVEPPSATEEPAS